MDQGRYRAWEKQLGKEFPKHHCLAAWDVIDNKHGFWLPV